MKKLTILSIVALFFGAFAIPTTEARGYKSRVHSTCKHCRKHVYAYYRPMVYHGVSRYSWVPSYHTSCNAYGCRTSQYQRPVAVRRPSYSYYNRSPYSYRRSSYHRSGYSGYGYRPGISVTIRR